MTEDAGHVISNPPSGSSSFAAESGRTLSFFFLAVLGFSFWFFMAVPFATHREGYSWLATVQNHPFAYAFSNSMSVTYRPLGQAAGFLGVLLLDPTIFPTSVLRQTLLQGFVYATFVLGWWFVYLAAAERRVMAVVAFGAGGVFFPGYVHLFHIYGIMYTPVILALGALFLFHARGNMGRHEVSLTALATVLALWHPFATALFVGFYFGFYLETFKQRSGTEHVRALGILVLGSSAALSLGLVFARHDAATMSLRTRLLGSLVSYQTSEINLAASVVAFALTLLVVFSMALPARLKLAAFLGASALGLVFLTKGLPLLLLWVSAVLVKLLLSRTWSLFFMTLAAAMFPFGGGIGAPVFALFPIMAAVYGTAYAWPQAEQALSFLKPQVAMGIIAVSAVVVVMVRAGMRVPVVTKAATPLLMERERTYQMENMLAWLHNSQYCGYDIALAVQSDNPIDSVESAITRRNRPPASLVDIQHLWNGVLRCNRANPGEREPGAVTITFGGPALPQSSPVYSIPSTVAGPATAWIKAKSQASASVR